MTKILGIDPGSRFTGYGIIEVNGSVHKYVSGGVIKLTKDKDYTQLGKIFVDLSDIIEQYQPDEVAIEQIFMHTNANSALVLGQARGAALVAVANKNKSIAEYSTREVKQAVVGYGAADKQQVQHMIKILLKLSKEPPEDMADALAVAICHANMKRGLLALQSKLRD